MLRQTIVVLGIGVVVAGLASTARAQSANRSSSDNSSVTLSGESLRRVESRTITGDYRTFFNTTPQVSQSSPGTNVGTATQSPSKPTVGEVDVVFGDTLNSQKNTATSFPPAGEVGDTERVKVQLQLGQ